MTMLTLQNENYYDLVTKKIPHYEENVKNNGTFSFIEHLNRMIVGLMVKNIKTVYSHFHLMLLLYFPIFFFFAEQEILPYIFSFFEQRWCMIFIIHFLSPFSLLFFFAVHFIKLLLCWFAILLGLVVGKKQLKTAVP